MKKGKVVLLDGGFFCHRAIFSWNMSKQRQINTKSDMFVPPSHYTYFMNILSVLKKIGVDKEIDKVILCLEGHSWRKSFMSCLSGDTDILTEDGWINIETFVDKKSDIKVATLNNESNTVEYHKPNNWFKYHHKGEMYKLGGRGHSLDIFMTPNHKHLCKSQKAKEFSLKTLEEIKNKSEVQSYRGFPWKKKNTNGYFTIPKGKSISSHMRGRNKFTYIVEYPSRKFKINTWLKFLGWYLSEGCLSHSRCAGHVKKYCVCIPQSKTANPKYCQEIYDLLSKEMGYKVTTHTRKNVTTMTISDVHLANYLKQFGTAFNKFIPRSLLNTLNKKQCKLLLHTLVKGDGSFRGKGFTYTTVSKRLLDNIQELGLKAGYAVTYSKPKKHNFYCISASLEKTPRCKKQVYKNQNMNVYCIDVPNHIFFVRRKGKTCWTGNSYKAQRAGKREEQKLIDWPMHYKKIGEVNDAINAGTDWHVMRHPNAEADDWMAQATKTFSDQQCIIVTIDKDLFMLAHRENVRIFSLNKKCHGTKGIYERVDAPLKILASKCNKGDVSDNILPRDSDVEEDFKLREFVIDLFHLPDFIEKPIHEELINLPNKEIHYDKLPFQNSLAKKFDDIYKPDKVISVEYCYALQNKREAKKKKKAKLKREADKIKKQKEKENKQ